MFLDSLKRSVLVREWNAILDPNIGRAGRAARGLARCGSSLFDILTESPREGDIDVVWKFALLPDPVLPRQSVSLKS